MNNFDFLKGNSFDAYTYFGVHLVEGGTVFRVFAPNAKTVKLFGEFSNWEEYDMYPAQMSGCYEIFVGHTLFLSPLPI